MLLYLYVCSIYRMSDIILTSAYTLPQAYQYCQQIVHKHYENFPVASWFLPKRLRLPISVIYAFARHADDLADEGDLDDTARFEALERYQHEFESALTTSKSSDPVLFALANVIQTHQLPEQLFYDLLTAFKMDTKTKRYNTFEDVLHYCHYSANPVGRLLLHLHKQDSADNLAHSDFICTALQLINFYQDIGQDYLENNRIYIPTDELKQFDVAIECFNSNNQNVNSTNIQQLMQFQISRAIEIMQSGSPLGKNLTGLFGFEIRMVIQGGLSIAHKLQNIPNVFDRPRLTKQDKFGMLYRALLKI